MNKIKFKKKKETFHCMFTTTRSGHELLKASVYKDGIYVTHCSFMTTCPL